MKLEKTFETSLRNQTIPGIDFDLYDILDKYAQDFQRCARLLYSEYYVKKAHDKNRIKSLWLKKYEITGRQFNAIKTQVEAIRSSVLECQNEHFKLVKGRIKSIEKWIKKSNKDIISCKKDVHRCRKSKSQRQQAGRELKYLKFKRHHKKRSAHRYKLKLDEIDQNIQTGKVCVCFGGKKRFLAQYHLKENGYENHNEWRKDYRFYRSHYFFVLGSHDESCGNQSCKYDPIKKTVKLRLTDRLHREIGIKTVELEDIFFKYGHDDILANFVSKKSISYRFIKRKTNEGSIRWYIQASIDVMRSRSHHAFETSLSNGAIGVDINSDHLAVCRVDASGNFKQALTLKLDTKNASSSRTRELCSQKVIQIVSLAKKHKIPVIIEKLDFSKKKESLKEQGKSYARMLSGFAYSTIISTIKRQCLLVGVHVYERNPAYSSVIGRIKYAPGYSFTAHHGAALVLARRGSYFSESLRIHGTSQQIEHLRKNVANIVGVVKPGKHVWSYWRVLGKSSGSLFERSTLRRPVRTSGSSPPR